MNSDEFFCMCCGVLIGLAAWSLSVHDATPVIVGVVLFVLFAFIAARIHDRKRDGE